MPFVLVTKPGVRFEVAHILAHLCDRASRAFPFDESIMVVAKNVRFLLHKEHGRCYGLFWYPEGGEFFTPYIEIACHDSVDLDRINHVGWHETRHFYQWKRKKIHDNGVDRDAEAFASEFKHWMKAYRHWPKEGT
jgi:hypothetical protein